MNIKKESFVKILQTIHNFDKLLVKLDELGIGIDNLADFEVDIMDAIELNEDYVWDDKIWEMIFVYNDKTNLEEIYDYIENYQSNPYNMRANISQKESDIRQKFLKGESD